MVVDFSILNEKKNENEFITYIEDKLKQGDKAIILENKVLKNEKELKSALIRYYLLSKNKRNIIKLGILKGQMDKDIENNYYLPDEIYDFIEEKQLKNILYIHRIKNKFNFLKPESIGINLDLSIAEKYFKEILE